MSERFVLCSTALQAAEFCLAERQLFAKNRPSVFSRLGQRHPDSEAALASSSSDFQRQAGCHSHSRPKEARHSDEQSRSRERSRSRTRQAPHSNGRSIRGRQATRSNGRPYRAREASTSNLVFFRGNALIGDSILVRMARCGGSFVRKDNSTCFGGATAKQLLHNLQALDEQYYPCRVVVLAGTNDMIQGADKYEVWDSLKRIVRLLQYKGGEVCILTVPPFNIHKPEHSDLEFLNEKIKLLSLSGCKVIDMNSRFKRNGLPLYDLYERRYMNGKQDLIHPNAEGLRVMMDAIQNIDQQSEENVERIHCPEGVLVEF